MKPLFREGECIMAGWVHVYAGHVVGRPMGAPMVNGPWDMIYRIRVIPKPSVVDEQIKAARAAHKPVRSLLKAKQDVVTERLKRG